MRRTLVLIGFIILTAFNVAFGQSIISGNVKDKNNNLITGANIYLEGTYEGTSSDVDGSFMFSTDLEGEYQLIVTFIGYKNSSKSLTLPSEGPIVFEIILEESINRMDAVVITAGNFTAGNTSKSEVLKPLDIVTTAGATADIAGALNTLPGTQTVGEEGRLFVRGGDGYETTTFIDGMIVLDSYSPTVPNVATRSRLSPMIFKGASFSTGGYSAEYGQGLSSALVLNSKDMATQNRTDFSFLTVGLEASHSQAWENSSLSGKLGYYNLDPYFNLVQQSIDWITAPTSGDLDLAFRQKIGKDGLLKTYGKMSKSGMTLNHEPIEFGVPNIHTKIDNNYIYINGSYRDLIGGEGEAGAMDISAGISYTHSQEFIALESDNINELESGYHIKANTGKDVGEHVYLKLGGELLNKKHEQLFQESETGFENRFEFDQNIYSSFIESEVYISNNILTRIGARYEYNTLTDQHDIDPRASLAIKTGKQGQISLAYGIFRQSPESRYVRIAKTLSPEVAEHRIINYQWSGERRTFRIEGYWKEYSNLAKFDPTNEFDPQSYTNDGHGYARGFDLFYRDYKSIQNADFWISYSFLDSERDYRDYPTLASPSFTSKHNFSVVYKHFITSFRTQIGLTWSYGSGRPYEDPNNVGFNNELTPSYQALSANISYLMKPNMILYLSASNLSGRENIFGYEYSSVANDSNYFEGRPIMAPAPRFLLVGFFITLTKDGVANQLPNL